MEEQFSVRLEKLKKLAALGVTPYPYRFDVHPPLQRRSSPPTRSTTPRN